MYYTSVEMFFKSRISVFTILFLFDICKGQMYMPPSMYLPYAYNDGIHLMKPQVQSGYPLYNLPIPQYPVLPKKKPEQDTNPDTFKMYMKTHQFDKIPHLKNVREPKASDKNHFGAPLVQSGLEPQLDFYNQDYDHYNQHRELKDTSEEKTKPLPVSRSIEDNSERSSLNGQNMKFVDELIEKQIKNLISLILDSFIQQVSHQYKNNPSSAMRSNVQPASASASFEDDPELILASTIMPIINPANKAVELAPHIKKPTKSTSEQNSAGSK